MSTDFLLVPAQLRGDMIVSLHRGGLSCGGGRLEL